MAVTKSKDKRTGITYVYSSESYWDKDLKAPRNRKKLIGKLDEKTGEVVPTGKRGRKPKDENAGSGSRDYRKLYEASEEHLREKDEKILALNTQLMETKQELKQAQQTLDRIRALIQ